MVCTDAAFVLLMNYKGYMGISLERATLLLCHLSTELGDAACAATGGGFTCPQCGATFSSRSHLSTHRRLTHRWKGGQHQCRFCPYTSDRTNVSRHERVHTREKPFWCQICGSAFSQKTSLVEHQRRHSGERPFGCEVCGQRFPAANQLVRHMRKHTDGRPYVCGVCGKSFAKKGDLVAHGCIH
ncbi:zinc finger protein 3-like [Ixodes scapularis]